VDRWHNFFTGALTPFRAVSIFGCLFAVIVVGWMWAKFVRSDYVTGVNLVRDQPIPFSHQHHVGGLSIDCRYCHTSVEKSSFAGIPSTKTCMNCHSQIWVSSPMLKEVRDSYQKDKALQWNRVHHCRASFISTIAFTSKKASVARPAMAVSTKCR